MHGFVNVFLAASARSERQRSTLVAVLDDADPARPARRRAGRVARQGGSALIVDASRLAWFMRPSPGFRIVQFLEPVVDLMGLI